MLSKARLVFVIAVAGELVGCSSSFGEAMNPINWYRDIMGLSADDDLSGGENDQNLQEGSKEPYPNLASVPNPPDTALSSVDRDKLVDSLIADRNNAKYSNEDLVAGRTGTSATPPAPATKNTPAPSTAAAPSSAPTAAPPTPTQSASVAPPAATTSPSTPQAAPPTPMQTASVAPAAPAPGSPAPATRPGQPPKRGSELPPAESPVTSPTVSSVPQGENAMAPPPVPQMAPPTQQVASAVPRATAPKLRPPGGGATEAAAPATTPAPRGAAISYRAAEIRFAPGSALLGDNRGDTIAEIVKLHNANGGSIRIVGHGEAGGANAAVAGLNLALDRAQAVAVALTNSGVPAKEISVEAAPVAARGGSDVPRAEVYLEN